MPLPAFSYTPNQQRRGKFDDTSDSSDDEGVDGILSLLRSTKPDSNYAAPKDISSIVKTPTSAASKAPFSSTTKSILSSQSSSNAKIPNSIRSTTSYTTSNAASMQRRVKFDPAFDKPNNGVSNAAVHSNRSR